MKFSRSLNTLTVREWSADLEKRSHYFVNKYEAQIYKKPNKSLLKFLTSAKNTYFEIRLLLHHCQTFDSLYAPDKCNSCKFDRKHTDSLDKSFKKWYPYLFKCLDGYHFQNALKNDCERLGITRIFNR